MTDDMTDDIASRKQVLRREALARRRTLSDSERRQAGRSLATMAFRNGGDIFRTGEAFQSDDAFPPDDAFQSGDAFGTDGVSRSGDAKPITVAAYVSMGTEVPMADLLDSLIERNLRVLVPVLGSGRDLGWSVFTGSDRLHDAGPRRPQEPDGPVLPAEAIAEADLIITAGIMVDRSGIRLGRGGGWYDRMLALKSPEARVITVVWPWEFVAGPLPHEPWDQPVDGVLTPAGLTMFR